MRILHAENTNDYRNIMRPDKGQPRVSSTTQWLQKERTLMGVLQGKSLLFLKAAIKELSDKAPLRKHYAKAPPTVSQTIDKAHAILPHPSFPNNIHALPIAPPADLLQQRQTDILLAKGRETKSRKAPSNRQPPQAAES